MSLFHKKNLKLWVAIIVSVLCCPIFLYAAEKVIESDQDKLIMEFAEGLNILDGDTLRLVYTGSALDPSALLRDSSGNPSYWGGTFWSNYSVLFINSNGITFGANANIQAASFIASTLNITDENFLAGKISNSYIFSKWVDKKGKSVINNGYIKVREGGQVVLLGSAVANGGTIEATLGSVVLAAGEAITLNLDTAGMISVVIDKSVQEEIFGQDGQKIDSAVKNTGTIIANGGKVVLAAKVLNDVFDYAINNTGIIEANSLVNNKGVMELIGEGGKIASVINTGSIIANGTSVNPFAGTIALNGNIVLQRGLVAANAEEGGDAGQIEIISENSTVLDEGSTTEACALGLAGNGGRILVDSTGGNTVVNKGAVIDVSAGAVSGDAGYIEVGAFEQLGFYGILNGRAPPGYNPATIKFTYHSTEVPPVIIITDQADYPPSGTPIISGSGFLPYQQVTINIFAPDGTQTTLNAVADAEGNFALTYAPASLMEGTYFVTGSDGSRSAVATFTDAVSGDYRTRATGNWNAASTWERYNGTDWVNATTPPTNSSAVTIRNGHTVSFNVNSVTVASLSVDAGGVVNFDVLTGNSLTVTGNVTNNGIIAVVNQAEARTHTLNVGGNFTNNGTFTTAATDDRLNVVLRGPVAQAIGGSAPIIFNNLTVNKSDGTATLNVAIIVNGNLNITAGTLDIGTYTLTVNEIIRINGGTLIATNGNIVAKGNVSLSSGTLNAPGAGHSFTVARNWSKTGGTFTHNSGTVTFDDSDISSISGSTIFYNFKCVTAGKILSFASGSTQTIEGTLTIIGTSSSHITLSTQQRWNIDVNGNQTVFYVSVSKSNASGGIITAVNSTDNRNNNANWSFVTDTTTTPPDTSISSAPGIWINTDTTTITWTGSDNYTPTPSLVYSYQVDGGAWSAFTSDTSVTLLGLSEGSHTFSVKAKDITANEDASPDMINFGVDTVAPTVSNGGFSGTAGNLGWYLSDGNLTLNFNDATSGLATQQYNLDGGAWTDYVAPFVVTGDGAPHTINYRATDNAGNPQTTGSVDINIDSTAPTVTLAPTTAANAAGWYNADVTVDVSASDSGSGIALVNPSITITTEGDSVIVNRSATDAAGNTGSASISLKIDKTTPVINITSPTDLATYDTPQTLSYTTSDNLSPTADITIVGPASSTVYNTLGTHSITVTATDLAGNNASASLSFIIVMPAFTVSQLSNATISRLLLPSLQQILLLRINTFTGPIYLYHPLTLVDISAFEQFVLTEGDYSFLDGALNLVGHEGLLPFLLK